MKFYIADAFTNKIFGGNPAGVVYLDEKADFPEVETMIKTAAELRYSETAFIKKTSQFKFETRYFTPTSEVDLCGHATIAAFSCLLWDNIIENNASYINITHAGKLNVSIEAGKIFMDMAQPQIITTINCEDAIIELYNVMGLDYKNDFSLLVSNHILETNSEFDFYPEIISTGLPDIILPVGSKEILYRINPDFDALTELSKRYKVVGVHAFTKGDSNVLAYCRNFAPLYGIDEEAATGTANGALSYYFYKKNIIKSNHLYDIIQGETMGRPSNISSIISIDENKLNIRIGGNGKVLACGEIFI